MPFKKLLLCSVLLAFAAFACSSFSTRRRVTENTLVSPYNPRLSLRAAPGLAFIGKSSCEERQVSPTSEKVAAIETEVFFFGNSDEKGVLTQLLAVRVQNFGPDPGVAWLPNPFEKARGALDQGEVAMEGESYRTIVLPMSQPLPAERDLAFLSEKGFRFYRPVLAKYWWACGGWNNPSAVQIEYYEAIPPGLGSASRWTPSRLNNKPQKEFFEAFRKNADESFRILPR